MENTNIGRVHSSSWVTRLLGILNLIFAGVGLVALLVNFVGFQRLPSSFTGDSPFFSRIFYPMSAVSLVLLSSLAYGGIQLLRNTPRSSAFCSVIFGLEIAIFVVFWLTWQLPFSPVSIVAVAGGLTNLGLALQAVTAYPVVALILLNIAQNKA